MAGLPVNIRKHPSFSHPNSGYSIFCHATLLARRVTETALRLARFNRMKFFDTEEEGMAFLHELMAQEDTGIKILSDEHKSV